MIKAENLKKTYIKDGVQTPALRGVSFNIDQGELIAIVGPSGSGKSTLMHIMGFLDRPSSGVYEFEGKSIDDLSDNDLAGVRNAKMGFVFQTFNLLSKTSVFDNVYLPVLYGEGDGFGKKRVRKAIEDVGLSHRIDHLSNQLSGGEQQRVAIARALINDPQIIFADEPTGNLDSKSGDQVMKVLEGLNKRGCTIVLVTHEQHIARRAERILSLHDGRIVDDQRLKR